MRRVTLLGRRCAPPPRRSRRVVTVSGGSSRTVSGPVALSTSRCSSSARRTRPGASSTAKASIRPRPRTSSPMPLQPAAQPLALGGAPRARKPGVARPRRAPRGRPPRRPGRRRTSSRGRRARARRRSRGAATQAPIGRPPPRPLASVITSGRDAGVLEAPERAGAAHAALDLVEDQQRAVLVAGRAGGLEQPALERVDAALALDRLDQHGGGALVDGGDERLRVVAGRPRGSRARAARTAPAWPPAGWPTARPSCGRGSRARARRSRPPGGACARA